MFLGNKLFDYILYPYVIYLTGILVGGTIMTALSALICLLILKFYDYSKQDWLGIETIRDLKGYKGEARAGRILAWFLKRSDLVSFFALSFLYDPFITTVWLRHKRYGGMTARDHRIFWGSLVVANGFWTVTCWFGINILQGVVTT
jgi:hypothetical protein